MSGPQEALNKMTVEWKWARAICLHASESTLTCSQIAPVMVTGKGLTFPRPKFSRFLWLLKSFSSRFSSSSRELQYRTWTDTEDGLRKLLLLLRIQSKIWDFLLLSNGLGCSNWLWGPHTFKPTCPCKWSLTPKDSSRPASQNRSHRLTACLFPSDYCENGEPEAWDWRIGSKVICVASQGPCLLICKQEERAAVGFG